MVSWGGAERKDGPRWAGASHMGLKRISHQLWPIVQAEFIPGY